MRFQQTKYYAIAIFVAILFSVSQASALIGSVRGGGGVPPVFSFILLETGGNLLLETGGKIKCENVC